MTKSIIINHLNKFDYKYSEQEEKLIVDLDFSLQIVIDLSVNEKIKISDRLKRLNFLSWPFEMSIKGSMIYNLIGFLIAFLIFLGIKKYYDNYSLTIIFLSAIFWNLNWLIYYLIKADNFKKEIINLTK